MSRLQDLVLYESAHSALAFREKSYGSTERAQLLQDVLALANAEVEGPRFLFFGVRDEPGKDRVVTGISTAAMTELRRALPALVARSIEPPFKIALRAMRIKHALVGLLCLSECEDPPYLLVRSVAGLAAGSGWVRRGTRQLPLLRADLQRMFAAKLAVATGAVALKVGFGGERLEEELTLGALPLEGLPSAVAAQKLRKILDAKESVKQILGRTETQFSRLMHAQVFGIEHAYEPHSEESLRMLIEKAEHDYHAADAHYEFEIRAHKLNLAVRNLGNTTLDNLIVQLKIPRIPGIGVAPVLVPAPGVELRRDGYPRVTIGRHTIGVQAEIGQLAPGDLTPVFREPPRFWAREAAAGKTIPIDCTVYARELREPLHDTLLIRIAELEIAAAAEHRAV